ncbi:uncharacterized protein J4E87_001480 [Alternaria ethzedia]|uniref:uncharacterized protein n=1 Tax=Alternaria ethzedia TaxID=181014 RepID=UPI0020C49C8D|nr:uncharacterized protein J4E87_001480 [Alternaria ethzedia]KAI4634307.1 hypothetical protein J4E87_001480 [Alternaria ethzedia]
MTSSTPSIPTLHTKAEYLKAVMYEGVTILEGTATWCKNCHIVAPEVAKMVAEYPNVKFYTYDVEECEDIAQELGVRSMPSFSVFKDGDIMEGVTGAKPKEVRRAIEGYLERDIENKMVVVADYEEAVARLHDTVGDDWNWILDTTLQQGKASLKELEDQYMRIALRHHGRRLHEDSYVPTISISELRRVVYAESGAWDDLVAHLNTWERIDDKRIRLERELRDKQQSKRRSEVREIQDDIRDNTERLEGIELEWQHLLARAYRKMTAANRAAKSHLKEPGFGRWAPVPVPVQVTATPESASIAVATASAPTTVAVTAAQVRVSDIPAQVEAAAINTEMGTASGAVTSSSKTKTAIVKLDERLSSLTLCPRLEQYADVKPVPWNNFSVGDIGWFPVLRPSLSVSSSDIHTEFGYICAKSYPIIIVEYLDDCMLGLIISTSHGNGLRLKGASIRDRSVPVVDQSSSFAVPDPSSWGADLSPRQTIRVEHLSGQYRPPASAYVDMLNAIMIPYDSRFRKEGTIVKDDVLALQRMRLSAVLMNSDAGGLGDPGSLWNYLTGWLKEVIGFEN